MSVAQKEILFTRAGSGRRAVVPPPALIVLPRASIRPAMILHHLFIRLLLLRRKDRHGVGNRRLERRLRLLAQRFLPLGMAFLDLVVLVLVFRTDQGGDLLLALFPQLVARLVLFPPRLVERIPDFLHFNLLSHGQIELGLDETAAP